MTGQVTILGAGSALPTFQNSPAGQMLTLGDKSFLIDCGEGVQLTMRQMGLKTARLYSIFISHLHGDHCFGLLGLISTFGMMHRTQPLHIYAHPDLEKLLRPMLDYHCEGLTKREVIFEDRTVTVETVPLKHMVPTCGFLFKESHRKLNPETGEFFREETKRYAYLSDTQYTEKVIEQIECVDLLFHESTYTEQFVDKCPNTMHSTAKQAATIAKKANVKQLLIGHFSSREDDHNLFLREAQEVFPNTILAVERTTIEF